MPACRVDYPPDAWKNDSRGPNRPRIGYWECDHTHEDSLEMFAGIEESTRAYILVALFPQAFAYSSNPSNNNYKLVTTPNNIREHIRIMNEPWGTECGEEWYSQNVMDIRKRILYEIFAPARGTDARLAKSKRPVKAMDYLEEAKGVLDGILFAKTAGWTGCYVAAPAKGEVELDLVQSTSSSTKSFNACPDALCIMEAQRAFEKVLE